MRIIQCICLLLFVKTVCSNCSRLIINQRLFITENESCVISQNFGFLLDLIEVAGVLTVQPTQHIHLQYNQLLFREHGKLVIDPSPLNFMIKFEQFTNTCEIDNLNQVEVLIKNKEDAQQSISDNQIFVHLNESALAGRKTIKLKNSENVVSVNQRVFLIAFDRDNNYLEEFHIQQIIENEIILDKYMAYSYVSYSKAILPHPMLVLLEKDEQITFKNACISIISKRLSGIAFVDPIYLYLQSETIDNCLFITSTKSQGNKILINGSMSKNIFEGIKENTIIKQNLLQQFENNLILNSQNLNISTYLVFHQNYIINSDIDLNLKWNNNYIMNSLCKQASLRVEVPTQMILNIKSLTSLNSTFSFFQEVNSIKISDSIYINSQAIWSSISENLSINKTYLFSNTVDTLLIIGIVKPPLQINIENSTVKGTFSRLIQEIFQTGAGFQKGKVVINLHNNTINVKGENSFNVSSLFVIKQKQFLYKSLNGRSFRSTNIKSYNLLSPFYLPSSILSLPENQEMSLYDPSYYKISNIQFVTARADEIVFQNKNNFFTKPILNSETNLIQTTSFQIWQLIFKNKNNLDTNPYLFRLSINQHNHQYANFGKYHLIIPFQKRQSTRIKIFEIEDIPILIITDSIEKLSSDSDIYLKHNIALNQLEVYWFQLKKESFEFTVEVLFCEEEEIMKEGICTNSCQGTLSGLYCGKEEMCQPGYFLSQQTKKCEKCSFGCKHCENEAICSECFSEFLRDADRCVGVCERKQYYHDKQCFFCIESCSICQDTNSNPSYESNCKQCEFVEQCHIESQNCNPTCLSCVGESILDCLSCNNNYDEMYGLCSAH